MAAMRPTPVMIPVNISVFSQGMTPSTGATAKFRELETVSPWNPGPDSQIRANLGCFLKFQLNSLRQVR